MRNNILGEVIGFNLGFLKDLNFYDWQTLILFSIIPRLMTLICFSFLFLLLTTRTSKLLSYQIKDTDKIVALHKDMVTGFATLVENRDENTGGHIKRTAKYVELLSKELMQKGIYSDSINDEFIENIVMAAPMHDIGKIAVSDSILQKKGKLTPEEFAQMKTHADKGGKIIQQTFNNVGTEEYRTMAYEVARFHHEKWDGTGYPDGLKTTDIPLAARIMAIADVFDAVSANRCYRSALPLEQCFELIENGSGSDFEPQLVDIFLSLKPQIVKIRNSQD